MTDYKQRLLQARETLKSRDAIRIENELNELKENSLSVKDEELKLEFQILIYNMLEFLGRNSEAIEELGNLLGKEMKSHTKKWALREMGLVSMRMQNKEKGFEYLKAYYDNAVEDGITTEIVDASLWLTKFYYAEKDFEQSMEYSNNALYASKKDNNLFAIAESQFFNGLILYKEGKENLALEILREAEETAIDAQLWALVHRIAIARSKIYIDKQNLEAVTMIINNLFKTIEPLSV